VGLLAHSIEQLRVGKVIRPRGRYTGRALEDASPALPADGGERTLDAATLDKNRLFKTVEP